MSHPSGVITKIMAYCDDTTLTTEDLTSIHGLFERTYIYCQWVGVNINHSKSEIVGYDFKSQKVISTASLKLGPNNLRQVAPSEPVKFLGTRVTIKLDMTPERNYIIQKVKEWSKVLNNHPYHPSQVNCITQIAVLAIVKFSAALAQWDDVSIRQLDTVIRQTQRKAWKLPPGCPDLALWAGEDHGSLAYPNSKAIIIKEETGLLHQCTSLDDDLARMVRWDMQNTVLRWGCNSLEETSK